jgi:hypothetical protein
MERSDVPEGDFPLLSEGAEFYWCIGYRDTPAGQRQRISTIRFVRKAHLRPANIENVFTRADELVELLAE